MNNETFEFRPLRVGTHASIIGMLILRGFHDLGNGTYAPVYKIEEKLELNRLGSHKYKEEAIKMVISIAQKSLESLMAAGCRFEVSLIERYKSSAEKDKFGKHSNNYLAEVYFYPIEGIDEETGDITYGSPENFNDYVISLMKKNEPNSQS